MSKKKVLITGASGYIGGRLTPNLHEAGHKVRVMTRDRRRLLDREWAEAVEIVEANALELETLPAAMEGIEIAYYMIHSMQRGDDFQQRDRDAAENFAKAAAEAGVQRIVYLGGLGSHDDNLSKHLSSRQEVGQMLGSYGVPVTEFRAAVIVGSGSASFEMIRYLTERVPVMILPKWTKTRTQPLAIRDALFYLEAALETPSEGSHIIEIGGGDVLTYGDMLKIYAEVRGLNRIGLQVPVLSPRLSSYWVHLVTPITATIARPLIDGVVNEVVVQSDKAKQLYPDIEPITYRFAVEKALEKLNARGIETTWADSLSSYNSLEDPYEFQDEQGMFMERRKRTIKASPEDVFQAVSRIGGSRGWLYLNWLWVMRGILDRFLGGPGYRERRDQNNLRMGDALDFWRVEDVEQNEYLRLRAEMLLPGQGWLEFQVKPNDKGNTILTQTAYFAPKGLLGFGYWYAMFFPHKFIFDGMIDALVIEALSIRHPDVESPQGRNPLSFRVMGIAVITGFVAALFWLTQRGSEAES